MRKKQESEESDSSSDDYKYETSEDDQEDENDDGFFEKEESDDSISEEEEEVAIVNRQSNRRAVSNEVFNDFAGDLDNMMSIKSENFSLDFLFSYLLYDYIEDNRETVRTYIRVISLASSIYHSKIVENGLSLQIG